MIDKTYCYQVETRRDGMAFVKGQSGNPSGRPAMPAEIREMLYKASPKALKLLVNAVEDEDKPFALRVDCAKT